MKVALVYSARDLAGVGMAEKIRDLQGDQFRMGNTSVELIKYEREVLYVKDEEQLCVKDADFIVVLSRHSGTPNVPIFTAHVPGNFGQAKFGGEHFTLGVAIPSLMKEYLKAVSRIAPKIGYEVGFEPTHHGPTLDTPLAFLEIGCDEVAWKDPKGVEAASYSVIEALENWKPGKYVSAIAFGGPHINNHFTAVELYTKFAIGHAARKLDARWVDLPMIKQALEKNGEVTEYAIVDNKGLRGEERARIEEALRELGVSVIRVKKILRESREEAKEKV